MLLGLTIPVLLCCRVVLWVFLLYSGAQLPVPWSAHGTARGLLQGKRQVRLRAEARDAAPGPGEQPHLPVHQLRPMAQSHNQTHTQILTPGGEGMELLLDRNGSTFKISWAQCTTQLHSYNVYWVTRFIDTPTQWVYPPSTSGSVGLDHGCSVSLCSLSHRPI